MSTALTSPSDNRQLCDQTRGQDTVVTCFYFYFASRGERSALGTLGSLPEQLVGRIERIPEKLSRAFQWQKNAIGRCELQYREDATGHLLAGEISLVTSAPD